MPHCYRCGRFLEPLKNNQRRRVKTGEYIHRRYPSAPVAQSTMRFGMRIVCPWCAKQIDREQFQAILREHLKVLAVILALIALIIFQRIFS